MVSPCVSMILIKRSMSPEFDNKDEDEALTNALGWRVSPAERCSCDLALEAEDAEFILEFLRLALLLLDKDEYVEDAAVAAVEAAVSEDDGRLFVLLAEDEVDILFTMNLT